MKKLTAAAILFCFAILLGAPAESWQAAASAPLTKPSRKVATFAGVVSADRKSFLCDKDNRTWAISNPDVLRGTEGRHATLRARVGASADELVVASAKPSRDERHAPRLDDAAFRK
jgi:hypothetical protein